MIDRLHVLLHSLGYDLAAPELLDVLWLARAMNHESPMTQPQPGPSAVRPSIPPTMEPVGGAGPELPVPPPEAAADEPRVEAPAPEPTGRPHRLYAADGGGTPDGAGTRARSVRAPGPRALSGTQPLARALRPLRSHRDHRYRMVADIEATVRLTAESGVLDVVSRPEQELQHTAVLLVDDSPSMRLWQPLAREVTRLLERAGVFRAVRVHRFALGRGHRPTGTPRTESPVTFVLTDGVDAEWQSPAADRFIEMWGRAGPLIVLPPLPRRLWRGTAFDAQPHPVVAEQPFTPARNLRVLDPLSGLPVGRTGVRPAVPVVALTPSSLSAWVRLVTRPGTPSLVDIALVNPGGGVPRASDAPSLMLPQHRLERFRASFSPDAYRLAMRLSAIRPLSLPVIQLVRIASLPGSSPTAVAEVLLGDLLLPLEASAPEDLRLPAATDGRSADPLYDFRPGIRDLLASGLSVEQSIQVVEEVGEALEPYLGRMPDFAALLDDPRGNEIRSAGTSAFAVLMSPVLDRLYHRTIPGADDQSPFEVPLRFTVFGQHLAWRGADPVPLGSSRQKAVLAALLLHRGQPVRDGALVDAVWGEQAPSDGALVARSFISQLQRELNSSGLEIDDTTDGYRLSAQDERNGPDLDLTAAERLYEEAKVARAEGDLVKARRAMTDALARTDGPPLEGIPGPYAMSQATRLTEWRFALLEFRIELDMEAGDHASIITELNELTQVYPVNEALRAHLMLALYRSGRQAEALAVYADTRRLLSEEFGLDPGPALTRLQQAILRADDASYLAVSTRSLPTRAISPVTPAQPMDGLRFTVLGPVRAWRDGEILPSGSPQQRALLAVLLLRDGHTATAGELIDALWGDDPPSQALATVRTYASRLRKTLGQDTLVSEAGGYAIRNPREAFDLTLAQDLAGEAERARGAGDPHQARALINKALGLWDGEALASLPGPFAENQRTSLEEWRLQLTETRLDLDLELGSQAEAVSELTAMRPLPVRAISPVTPAQPMDGLRFTVLGPVRAWRDGEILPSGSPQQRALLAVLLLRDGHTATAGELIDALWGDDPPSQALATVRTYASRLRKTLGQDTLVSEAGGYAIRNPREAFDLTLAQDLAGEAERARGAGDPHQARALINKALGLWDGEALASLPGPFAENQRTSLEEWRLQLTETRLDLDLELGSQAEAVSELTALTAAHPLRERLRELLMVALYRSGRQAEALAVYADTRRLLAEELGVDPRPELAQLQQRILQADEELARLADAPEPPPAIPAQLPAPTPDFTGHQNELREIIQHLTHGSVTTITALGGLGGIGKTTIAVQAAHAVRAHFPDGQLYSDLQGTGVHASTAEAVLGSFLRALGIADSAIPDTLDERAALYRSSLDGRRVLILLDNARDAAQIRPLLPGTAHCATLVTSRVRMVDLAGAHLVDLDVMSAEEALHLFTRIVGEGRVGAEREAALDVVAACGFLPLAIRIAASRLAARRAWTVSVLAAKLADERRRLDELQAGDLAVKATFELGYGQLEPAQAQAFRLLGLADGPGISLTAAAALLNREPHLAEVLLEELVETSFLQSTATGRYNYHDLVRLYARACAERDEQPPHEREMALTRLLDFYLATAAEVYALEHPGDRLVDHLEPTEQRGLTFASRPAAIDWLYAEAASLLAAVRQSTGRSLRRAVDTLWATQDLADSGATSLQYEATATALWKEAAQRSDPRAEGRVALVVARTHMSAGRFTPAGDAASRALAISENCGDALTACWSQNSLGTIALYLNRYEQADSHFTAALASFQALDDRPGEASVLCNLSRVRLAVGEVTSALTLAEQGKVIYDALGMSLRAANARYSLGLALTAAQQFDEAISMLNEALLRFSDSRQHLWEGMTLFRIAEAELAANRPAPALRLAEQALAVMAGVGGEWRRGNVLTVLGRALQAVGQVDRARVCWQEALDIFEELGSPEAGQLHELIEGGISSSVPNSA